MLIEGNNKNKLLWKLGRVEKAPSDHDYKTCCYELKIDEELLKRTVQHMHSLKLKKKKIFFFIILNFLFFSFEIIVSQLSGTVDSTV